MTSSGHKQKGTSVVWDSGTNVVKGCAERQGLKKGCGRRENAPVGGFIRIRKRRFAGRPETSGKHLGNTSALNKLGKDKAHDLYSSLAFWPVGHEELTRETLSPVLATTR